MLSKFKLNQLYFKDTQFANLMTRRIFNVLLIANPYDAFMLEDDGRIDEKIFNEYTSLSLRYPPRFTQVSTCEEALSQLSSMPYDLIIRAHHYGNSDPVQPRHHQTHCQRGSQFVRLYLLLAGEHRLAGFHHQADRGQDESGARRQ